MASKVAEALMIRGHLQSKKKWKKGRFRSSTKLEKDECAFCWEKDHWNKDCLKLKN